MSWNLLTYALPSFRILETIRCYHPSTYKRFEDVPESPLSYNIKDIVERILTTQNQPGMPFQRRVEDIIAELPQTAKSRDVKGIIEARLKVIATSDVSPIFATGTDCEDGRYYISVAPEEQEEAAKALAWTITHEVGHLLGDDWVEMSGAKMISSLVSTFATTYFLSWSLLHCVGTVILTNAVTHVAMSHRAEKRADDFANTHCTGQERERGIEYLQSVKNRNSEQGGLISRILSRVFHPDPDSRIAKIRASLVGVKRE